MSFNRLLAITAWGVLVLVAVWARTALLNSPISLTESLAWFFVGCAPVAVLLVIFRGPAPSTVAQVLYGAEQADQAGAAGSSSRQGRP